MLLYLELVISSCEDGYELRTRAQPKAAWLLASPRRLPYVLDIVSWNVCIERNLDHTNNVNEVSHVVR